MRKDSKFKEEIEDLDDLMTKMNASTLTGKRVKAIKVEASVKKPVSDAALIEPKVIR